MKDKIYVARLEQKQTEFPIRYTGMCKHHVSEEKSVLSFRFSRTSIFYDDIGIVEILATPKKSESENILAGDYECQISTRKYGEKNSSQIEKEWDEVREFKVSQKQLEFFIVIDEVISGITVDLREDYSDFFEE